MIFRALHRDAGRFAYNVCGLLVHLLLVDIVNVMVVGVVLVCDEMPGMIYTCGRFGLIIDPRPPEIMLQDIVATIVISLADSIYCLAGFASSSLRICLMMSLVLNLPLQ